MVYMMVKTLKCITLQIDYEDMLTTLVKSVMIRKYYDYKVYFHNFSKWGILIENIGQIGET